MQDWAVTLQTKHDKAKKNNTDTSRSPILISDHCFFSALLEAKVKKDLVFKDGNEQHDAEPG